jgi:DNA repair exonuclease SbcCD nuclease subunit
MFRLLHTADWQIGMKAVHVGAAGDRVREARLRAAHNVVAIARERRVDAIVLAGDTFEDNAVDRALVARVVEILASADAPVLVLPGNHDPLAPGSALEHRAFAAARDRVRVLATCEPVRLGEATFHPCPLREKHGRTDPTSAITADGGSGIRIGVAHGTLRAAGVEADDDFPIDPASAERLSLDYLALGHWHSHFESKGKDGVARIAYSGTHEQTKFGEGASGHALVVAIRERGAPPEIERVRTGVLRWREVERDVSESADVERLVRDLDAVPDANQTLVDVTVRGVLPSAELERLEQLRRFLADRFLFGRLDASAVAPSPTDTRWIDELPPGTAQHAARLLLAQASSDALGAPVAREALEQLYSLAHGSGR